MLFDVQAALAEILGTEAATLATLATNRGGVAGVASVAAPHPPHDAASGQVLPARAKRPANTAPHSPIPSARGPETFPNGFCHLTGRPRTWSGKVVSLDDWRRLTDWERAGPAGRLFCGTCRAWVAPDSGCREPGCWNWNGEAPRC